MPTSVPNFNFSSSNGFRDNEGVPKFNVEATTPCRTHTLKPLRVLQVLGKVKSASQILASYLYASCSYANMYFP